MNHWQGSIVTFPLAVQKIAVEDDQNQLWSFKLFIKTQKDVNDAMIS
jgi:hypothetical protein